jgi:UDPglucose--hexose-1-phosphate uridylyltransferase
MPKAHSAGFETMTNEDAAGLAGILFDVVDRIDRVFGDPDYNLIVRSAPFQYRGNWHWRIEVLPRVTTTAGWEWGTGLLINTMFPEEAARRLRDARP